jgi:hypothetical protein
LANRSVSEAHEEKRLVSLVRGAAAEANKLSFHSLWCPHRNEGDGGNDSDQEHGERK